MNIIELKPPERSRGVTIGWEGSEGSGQGTHTFIKLGKGEGEGRRKKNKWIKENGRNKNVAK